MRGPVSLHREERTNPMRTSLSRVGCVVIGALALGFCLDAEAGVSRMYIVHGGFNDGSAHGGEIGTVDINTGAYTSLGVPTQAGMTGLAGIGATLYASTSNHSLISMDLSGGLLTEDLFFGSGFSAANGDRINDLAVYQGVLYAVGRIAGADSLFTVNENTAELTLIGATPTSNGFDSIAFDGGGRLYNQATVDVLNEIDPGTGGLLNVVGAGVPGGALGLGFNPDDGLLYGSTFGGEFLSDKIYSVSTSDGSSNLLVDYGDGRKIQDVYFYVPAPGTVVLLAIAGIGARRRRR